MGEWSLWREKLSRKAGYDFNGLNSALALSGLYWSFIRCGYGGFLVKSWVIVKICVVPFGFVAGYVSEMKGVVETRNKTNDERFSF